MRNTYYHSLNGVEYDFSKYIARHSGDKIVTYKTVAGQSVNLSFYYPSKYSTEEKYPVFVFIHGGGWSTHRIFDDQKEWSGDYLGFLARYYAEKGYIAVSIDYRLLQENGQTDGFGLIDLYEDCVEAVCYLKKHENEYGLDFSQSVLLGESAGGYLAGALATFHYRTCPRFSKVILVNAITNLLDSRWGLRVPKNSKHPLLAGKTKTESAVMLSPVYQICDRTPQVLLLHGTEDIAVHPGHSQIFRDEMLLKEKIVELHWIENTEHAFLLAEYKMECGVSLEATSIAVDIIDGWLFI